VAQGTGKFVLGPSAQARLHPSPRAKEDQGIDTGQATPSVRVRAIAALRQYRKDLVEYVRVDLVHETRRRNLVLGDASEVVQRQPLRPVQRAALVLVPRSRSERRQPFGRRIMASRV
jgi:hypothetical protein